MGWEKDGRYYTRSIRVGRQVIREYVGCGFVAEVAAQKDYQQREERDRTRTLLKAERDADRKQERILRKYCKSVDTILMQVLMAAGYHNHKGQWRRRRDNKDRSGER